jgi:hypothetical protein
MPARISSLQRTAGNRAVAGLLLARARVTTGAKFRASVPVRAGGGNAQEARLTTLEQQIYNRLESYNQLSRGKLNRRVKLLGELDERIYEWFTTLAITDFDTEPRAQFMRRLMDKLQAEHVKVVERALQTNVAPIYRHGLTAPEKQQATRLWNSVAQNAGMIQIVPGGDPKFRAKTLSNLAKMLHTGIGREEIEFLDQTPAGGAPPGVTAGSLPTPPAGRAVTGWETYIAPDTQDLQSVGFGMATGTDDGSSNRPLSQVHQFGAGEHSYKKLNVPPATLADYPVVSDAAQYNRALVGGKAGFAINAAATTDYYEFGHGEGNLVIMKYGQFARGLGAGNVEVISPDFVLLAHELGHALRVRGGAYAQDEQFGWFGENSPKWQNKGEEMSNVIGIENPIRAQSGITERSTYNTWKFVYGMPAIAHLSTQMFPVLNRLRPMGFDDEQVWAWAKTVPAARKLYLLTAIGNSGLSDADRDERKKLKDEISSPVLAEAAAALPTVFDDLLATHVATMLLPRLRAVSDDPTKAAALMTGLSVTERVQALAYLLEHQGTLDQIKQLLHFKMGARLGTRQSDRAAARLAALQSLIAPGGTEAGARTDRAAALATG